MDEQPTGSSRYVRGPWIIAGAVVLAAVIVAIALVARPGARPAGLGEIGQDAGNLVTLHAQTLAQDRNAQAYLRNALVAAKTMFVDSDTYAFADSTGLPTVEPSICYVEPDVASAPAAAACGDEEPPVSVYAKDRVWAAAKLSASGTCFWIKDNITSGTNYGSGLPCTGEAAASAEDTVWR